ncbi:MAG: amino acid ABC transporter substrate-binding protein [Chitinophagaceae bacterium]
MKKALLFVLGALMAHASVFSQVDSVSVQPVVDSVIVKHNKIAIFAPLYLDSAFDANQEYRYTKNIFPKFINSGLEFYEGVQLALDSLANEHAELEVYIYDTRSAKETLEQQLARPELIDVSLVIANCSANEIHPFSQFALAKNIPFINATVPNGTGITSNPYFVLLNPTLKTQCEGIYRYIQKYYSIEPLVVFRRKGTRDDMVKTIFDDFSKATVSIPLKMRYVTLSDSFTVDQLKQHLDPKRKTLCVSGSLDANFGRRLILKLATITKEYPTIVMGMPTWETISKDFTRPEFKGIEIIYSTPFYNAKTNPVSVSISNYFNTEMYSRPSDMVFRGYETTWKFSKLLLQYGKDISSNLTSKQYHVFTEYDIQPVISRTTNTLEYFENKKLYFLKWLDGIIKVSN